LGEEVRGAVVGCGLFGSVHARAFAEYARSKLAWVCDVDEARARAAASEWGARPTADIDAICRDESVAGVSVATPDFAHREPVMRLIAAGKHVLVEKPLATSVDEAREMVEAARERKVHLMVDFHNRWSPQAAEAKEMIDSGEFGEPVMAYARLSNPRLVPMEMLKWSGRSGPEWFLMPHLVDLVRWLFDDEAVSVHAVGRKGLLASKGCDAYDAIQAQVRFRKSFATFEAAWILPETWPCIIDFKVDLLGTSGKIEMVADDQGLSLAGKTFRRSLLAARAEALGLPTGYMRLPMMHFVDCLAEGRAPEPSGGDGLAVTAIIEAALRSMREGRAVEVSQEE